MSRLLPSGSSGSETHRCDQCDSQKEIKLEKDPGGLYDYYYADSHFEKRGKKYRLDNKNWIVAHINTGQSSLGDLSPIGHSVIVVEGIELKKLPTSSLYEPTPVYFVRYYQLAYSRDPEEKKQELYRVSVSKKHNHHHLSPFYHSAKVWPNCNADRVKAMMRAIKLEADKLVHYDIRGNRDLFMLRNEEKTLQISTQENEYHRLLLLLDEKLLPDQEHFPQQTFYLTRTRDDGGSSDAKNSTNPWSTVFWLKDKEICHKALDEAVLEQLKQNGLPEPKMVESDTTEITNKKDVLIHWLTALCFNHIERHNCTSWAIKHLNTVVKDSVTIFDKWAFKPKMHAQDTGLLTSAPSCIIL